MLAFVMLNPSVADALQDDPTVRRCRGFAEAFGYTWFSVVNLFAYRATDPRELAAFLAGGGNAVGPRNDAHVLRAASEASEIVLAWGGSVPESARADDVIAALRAKGHGDRLRALGWTAAGDPRHPLFMPSNSELKVLH